MTAREIYAGLKSLGYPVAYRQFQEGNVPTAPYIVWYVNSTDNFAADGIVYDKTYNVYIELYADKKDFEAESKIEQWLTDNEIYYDYDELYIESEKYIETLYICQIGGLNG